ncbi:receptor-like protein kinase HSL1 [Cajanus cajan]|uniref:receptor-like protein kinase HSL1 n=1 Tax=Cajanus cajan TaxID=3821 RepID=UPI00098D809D|nr:receptor-like protein kinase HSL1 [Cajanus cajan]
MLHLNTFHLSSLFLFLSLTTTLSLNQDGLFLLQARLQLSDPTNALASWNRRDATPCNWTYVTCHPSSAAVTVLDLSNLQLSGPVPAAPLCRLPALSNLSLALNNLNAALPSAAFSACAALRHLDLSQNLISGPLPAALANLPSLEYLDLSSNNFSGEIPATFGTFRRLEYLSLVSNLINGTIPSSLGNLSTLKKLHLAYNTFNAGPIPQEFGNLTNLEELWLAGCDLVGPIPHSLGKLTKLRNLDLSMNTLVGNIPEQLVSGLNSIVQIELYQNSLSGALPRAAFVNLTHLERFDASANELTGTIPDELCGLRKLGSLNLYDNKLEGALPESIVLSESLYEVKLFNNSLNGSLPRGLGGGSKLQRLDVSYNRFSGEIPARLCAGGVLEELILIYNSFSGRIPESLGECKSLRRVRFRNNNLSGVVPEGLWGLPHLYLLELVENSLSGSISNAVSGARNLSILLISGNKFSGSVPEGIGELVSLEEFVASHNSLTGRIPSSIVRLSQLDRLVLRDNKLFGEIPVGVGGWKKLNELDLANNRLDGNVPKELGNLPGLNYLDLSGNRFSGEIPIELQNLKLNLLNLSNNQLSGEIPPLYANDNYRKSFLGNPGLCRALSGLCPSLGESEGKSRKYVWIFRFIFVLAGIVLIVGVAWFYFKFRDFKKMKKGFHISKWRSFHKLGFSEFEIVKLLSEDNVIGSGASGKVYKVALSNGEVVAVKKLLGANKMGNNGASDSEKDGFEIEVETLGKIRHKNIVRLWCCCNNRDSKLLVYEYMPNGSLADLLHSSKKGLLDWATRYKIAIDAAEGLSYLHHDCVPPIVHRDVKSSNILLDDEFGAKVADFGVAKIVNGPNQGAESMSVIAGSYGYIAPEYAYTLRVNEKSDIYSFGVVILELVTGKPPLDQEYGEKDLVKWVHSTLDQKGQDQVIDPTLDVQHREEISKVLNVGLLCTSSLPITRPSMRRVVKMLKEVTALPKSMSGKLSPYFQEDASDNDHQGSLV